MMMPEPREWVVHHLTSPHLPFAAYSTVYAGSGMSKNTQQPVERDAAERIAPERQRVIVLIAEDEETIAETLGMIVEDAGFVPILAHDGREALALTRQHRPQLIITDLMMPYVSGADLIAAVRGDADRQGAAPPAVIVVTAASRALAERVGADIVITKPFDVARIEAAIQKLLGDGAH